ncbi:hypothetical protein [Micromonospora deserti]|nr:hypothetical protein [Micromonospora deserti]
MSGKVCDGIIQEELRRIGGEAIKDDRPVRDIMAGHAHREK